MFGYGSCLGGLWYVIVRHEMLLVLDLVVFGLSISEVLWKEKNMAIVSQQRRQIQHISAPAHCNLIVSNDSTPCI
jgi:hypothetical protein